MIFHMDEIAKAGVVLTNISHLITDIGVENLEIKILVKGDAVKVFIKSTSEFGPLLQDLAEKKVNFNICDTSMRNFVIDKKDLFDFVTVDTACT